VEVIVIHYHGTPIGGTRADVIRFLMGRHAFISFARPDDLSAAMECCQSFALDNGAFTLWKKGGDVDFVAYHAWVQSIARHPGCDFAIIPDKIGGTEEENQDLVTRWLRAGCHAKSVPVWHLHESLDWLDWLVSNFHLVALGSSGEWSTPGTGPWWKRMSDAMRVICDTSGRPRCKLHGLRMLDPAVFTKLPLSSADSTNAAVNSGSVSRFGMYVPPTASQRAEVIAARIEAHNSAPTWDAPVQGDIFEAFA
jgi:hypothetical protein